MAIYLDEQTRPYLERKFKVVADSDFIGKRIQKALQADRELAETVATCEHELGSFIGNRVSCVKCQSLAVVGCLINWERTETEAVGAGFPLSVSAKGEPSASKLRPPKQKKA